MSKDFGDDQVIMEVDCNHVHIHRALNPKEKVILKNLDCQLCPKPAKRATKVARNNLNGIDQRVCDVCFEMWSRKCKVSVVLEISGKQDIEISKVRQMESSPVARK